MNKINAFIKIQIFTNPFCLTIFVLQSNYYEERFFIRSIGSGTSL